jgi:mRNA interferase MazF
MIRGEIWWADFGIPFGGDPGFRRPVLILQDDAFNVSAINTVIVVPLTTNLALEAAPGNVLLDKEESGLPKDSVIVVSQIGAIDKDRLIEKAAKLGKGSIEDVENGIRLVSGIK